MLTIYGREARFCDGLSRRQFLSAGSLALGGLSLPRILEAEAGAGRGAAQRSSNKAIIMIYLPGGPPHQDTFDIKVDAPKEIRGEFQPISTAVPGIEICELLPGLARRMHRLIAIRTVVGARDDHSSYQCVTGRLRGRQEPPGGWPELGSVVSRLQGSTHPALPPFVNLAPVMQHRPYNAGLSGFLGVAHAPFRPDGDGRDDMVLNGITLERLSDRRALLSSFDRFRRQADASGLMSGYDAFTRQAFGVLTASRLAEALDLDREDPRVRERYGKGTARHQGDGAPALTEHFLLARRLVEAGVRCVTVSYSFWDWHGGNFDNARRHLPGLDRGVSALIDDLHQRGLENDVTVIVWGEFGRTPKINKDAGRDHWPRVSSALLFGGGMRAGQAIGETNKYGEEPRARPVHFQEIFATLYHNLGIDVETATITDLSGRPQYLVEGGVEPIAELI
jgi:hypothetical protein